MSNVVAQATVGFSEEKDKEGSGLILELGGFNLSNPYERFVHQYERSYLSGEQDREIMATIGSIRLFTSTPKIQKKVEAVTFSKSNKQTLKYPLESGFTILSQTSFTGYINNSFVQGFQPQFRFDPIENSVVIEGDIECWGSISVQYETKYSIYLYRAKYKEIKSPSGSLFGDEEVGTVFSRVGLAMATLDMPPYQQWGRQPKVEIYRVTSEYLATPKGEMEIPDDYPNNRVHDNGFRVPNKNNTIAQTRTHEIVSLHGLEYSNYPALFAPYNGANVFWRPKYKFVKASPPQGYSERKAAGILSWEDSQWEELDWDAIKMGVKSRYPDIDIKD